MRTPEGLTGRQVECGTLDELVDAVRRTGESRALVVHGEAGVGKTALLDHVAAHATGCRVARAGGVQSEMELAFAGLHQLCAPVLDRLTALPAPQREALRIAFGMSEGPAPDRFMIGLAVLSLLSHVAERQPLVCLVDDAQWLDQASAQALAFVARRLDAESVGLVFAARVPGDVLAGLPDLVVTGLGRGDARALLDSALSGPIDERVRDQIVAETRGNPLALLELPRSLTATELAGGFAFPGALAGGVEESFQRRVAVLPGETRRLLLLAAADPTGNPSLVWRAAGRLGIGVGAEDDAARAGLVEFGVRVTFRHPLARSAVYRSASVPDRHEAHGALAAVTDPERDPDRRAWHRAQAAPGPDEEVAAELEQSAGRARARGGQAAAAAFLQQSAALTLDPVRRATRALAAARAKTQAGSFDEARELLVMAESAPPDDERQANVDVVRARLAFITDRGAEAPALLLNAARRLERTDTDAARATYLDALLAAAFAGRLASRGNDVVAVARAARGAPAPGHPPSATDLMLEGTVLLHLGDPASVPTLREALTGFGSGMTVEEELRRLYMAYVNALRLWDAEAGETLTARFVQLARDTGTLSELPLALTARVHMLLFAGDLTAATVLVDELRAVKEATGSVLAPYGALRLAALRGDEAHASALIHDTIQDVTRRGEGIGISFAEWANIELHNGLGDYDKAVAAGLRATAYGKDLAVTGWSLIELVEAAVRNNMTDIAAEAYDQLAALAGAFDADWTRGALARSHALLCEGEAAESRYREAIAHFDRTWLRVDLARAHLLYGEWLRRARRRGEAREQLRIAHSMLESMGVAAFAERAGRELLATGETARRRSSTGGHGELTAQEAHIARLARDGLSNPEIGIRLFISAHTVQYHLRKVFAKLDITSRSQLDRVLPAD